MSSAMSHVHKGFGVVRPYLHGPVDLPEFLQRTFNAVELERNEDGPTLLQIGDSLLWIEAGDLPPHVSPWVGSIYVYVEDVDAVYGRAIELGAKSISRLKTSRTTSAKRALSIREVIRGGSRLTSRYVSCVI